MLTNSSNRARHSLRGELQGLHSHHAAAPRQPGKPSLPIAKFMIRVLTTSLDPLDLLRGRAFGRVYRCTYREPARVQGHLRRTCWHRRQACAVDAHTPLNPPNRTCYDGSGAACAGEMWPLPLSHAGVRFPWFFWPPLNFWQSVAE